MRLGLGRSLRCPTESLTLGWHELEPYDLEWGTHQWSQLIARLNPQLEDWQSHCAAILEVRRVTLHQPHTLALEITSSIRRVSPGKQTCLYKLSTHTSLFSVHVGGAVVSRLLVLADSLRSSVARSAMAAINDLFLFAAQYVCLCLSVCATNVCVMCATNVYTFMCVYIHSIFNCDPADGRSSCE